MLDLRIYALEGANYRLKIPQLHREIIIDKCKYTVKKNGVTITLFKDDKSRHWTDIKPKKSLISPETDKKVMSEEPSRNMDNVMDMMKDMYQRGDDETKRMVT